MVFSAPRSLSLQKAGMSMLSLVAGAVAEVVAVEVRVVISREF